MFIPLTTINYLLSTTILSSTLVEYTLSLVIFGEVIFYLQLMFTRRWWPWGTTLLSCDQDNFNSGIESENPCNVLVNKLHCRTSIHWALPECGMNVQKAAFSIWIRTQINLMICFAINCSLVTKSFSKWDVGTDHDSSYEGSHASLVPSIEIWSEKVTWKFNHGN